MVSTKRVPAHKIFEILLMNNFFTILSLTPEWIFSNFSKTEYRYTGHKMVTVSGDKNDEISRLQNRKHALVCVTSAEL